MTVILYAYRQIIEFQGEQLSNIILSETHPRLCTLSEPVECIGKIELKELHFSESKKEQSENDDPHFPFSHLFNPDGSVK